jgi:CheY-like chemotaxis protein/two-component sensor histidine kinase
MKSSAVSEQIREEAALLVDRQIVQMTHLLNDLLDVSRVTLGKIELRLQKIPLSDVIGMAVESVLPLIDSRDQHLSVDVPNHPVWLNADPTRMAQIFSNLLNNAAKYTQKTGHIQITAHEDAEGIIVKISDDGIGIPKEMQPHIFDLFSQVDSSMERAQGGLGIGLTLVKNLTEMHKGSVKVYSEGKGKGSVFTVHLPTHASQQGGAEYNPPDAAGTAKTNMYRVLIVDDNEASAKTLGWMLEMMGHDIRLAHEGRKAIETADAYNPHIILLDIGLPGMNGYEVCETLRQRPALKNCVIIAQTGWGQKEHVERSRAAGFNHHLVKPIRMEKLQEIFQTI